MVEVDHDWWEMAKRAARDLRGMAVGTMMRDYSYYEDVLAN
jgi:hypothetical protein